MEYLLLIAQTITPYWVEFIKDAPYFIGFLMPFLIQIITTRLKHDEEKVWVSIVICFLAAAVLNWDAIKYGNLHDIVNSFGLVFAQSHLVFITFFRNSAWRDKMIGFFGDTPVSTKKAPAELG